MNLRIWWWIEPPQKRNLFEVQDGVLEAIKNTLTANGIDLPSPTQQILLHDQTEQSDGDRSRQREGWSAGGAEPPKPRSLAAEVRRLVRALPGSEAGESSENGRGAHP